MTEDLADLIGGDEQQEQEAEIEDVAAVIGDEFKPAMPRVERSVEIEVVEPESTVLVLPNGTVVDTEVMVEVVAAIKDLDLMRGQVAAARRRLMEVVMEERRRVGGAATMHFGRHTVTVSVAKEIEWDMDELGKLREAGLPESTWEELVTTTVSEKVNAAVANRISKANDDYAKIIAGARTDHEKNPSVTVK